VFEQDIVLAILHSRPLGLFRAVVATGNATDPALLTASVEKPLQLIGNTIEPESAGVGQKKE
jgi:hypothetical protein